LEYRLSCPSPWTTKDLVCVCRGLPTAFMNWIRGRDKSEILREALEGVGKGQQFDLKHADSLYRRLDELIGVDIDFLLAGHSHLERAMIRQDGERFYYNSGTWVRLIRLTSDVLGSGKQFEKIYKKLAEGTMKALDETPHLVLRKPAVVSITTDASGTTGRLQRVNLAGTEPLLSTIEGSEFTRS
ncbi:MAG: hypothetical protein O3C40_30195, partial [Planctomycetota bacterium]|nr:hypothetical protein [Planctomycetota bacterium]